MRREDRKYLGKVLKKLVKAGFLHPHGVNVVLVESKLLCHDVRNRPRLGSFEVLVNPRTRRPVFKSQPVINVARKRRDWKDTLFHELAHYEQFVNRKPLIERGVERRGRTLRRMYG